MQEDGAGGQPKNHITHGAGVCVVAVSRMCESSPVRVHGVWRLELVRSCPALFAIYDLTLTFGARNQRFYSTRHCTHARTHFTKLLKDIIR